MRVAVLGASGAMAQVVVRDLTEMNPEVEITAADRRRPEFGHARVRGAEIDVTDVGATAELLAGHDAVLNCVTYYLNLQVMRAALAAHVPYSDLGGLYHGSMLQFELDSEFRAAGLVALLGMGSTPGITNAMAGKLAFGMERVDEIHVRVGCLDRTASGPLAVPYALDTVLDEFALEPMVLEEGVARTVPPLSGREEIDFPAPVGQMTAISTLHSEVAMFPRSFPGLRAASFKVAFEPSFVEKVALLVELGFAGRDPLVRGASPREMLLAVAGQLPAAGGSPDDADALRVMVRGARNGREVEATGECVALPHREWGFGAGALDTGVPLAIAGVMLARGEIPGAGVLCPETSLPFDRFFAELARRGMQARFEERAR
jgi:saccharopine dehydrogenase-like NADP-dependent oxidoreductase